MYSSRGDVSLNDTDDRFQRLKKELHERLIGNLDLRVLQSMDSSQLRVQLRGEAEQLCRAHSELLTQDERDRLVEEIIFETLGLGPLEPLMHDPTISDILINGPNDVYVERRGRLEKTVVRFHDLEHLISIVQRIAARIGRRIDEASPIVDARLPDGSRMNAIIRPLALDGALVSIRRFSARPLTAGDFISRGSATPEIMEFLAGCVQARMNILVSGGTGSGKTTLLNFLSGFIGKDERIATIEDAAELQLQQPHVARMETRPPNLEGKGEVTSRHLIRNALRMRPDRIIVGECRGNEAFDMLQAMSTGHDGSLTTLHANNARDALSRLEMLVGLAAPELPMWFIHKQISTSINIVVQTSRVSGGQRKIMQVSEVTGAAGNTIAMHDIFHYQQTHVNDNLNAEGGYWATGIRPQCLQRLQAAGVEISPQCFDKRQLTTTRIDAIG
ncbi:MAG: CpaF family protein [bacterium]|nr:CpaF family protein [bacterium]